MVADPVSVDVPDAVPEIATGITATIVPEAVDVPVAVPTIAARALMEPTTVDVPAAVPISVGSEIGRTNLSPETPVVGAPSVSVRRGISVFCQPGVEKDWLVVPMCGVVDRKDTLERAIDDQPQAKSMRPCGRKLDAAGTYDRSERQAPSLTTGRLVICITYSITLIVPDMTFKYAMG
jgi:hypothetical protein